MHFNIGVICLVLIFLVLFLLFTVKFTTTGLFCRNYTVNMVRDFTYPVARRDESVVDDFHGKKVRLFRDQNDHQLD